MGARKVLNNSALPEPREKNERTLFFLDRGHGDCDARDQNTIIVEI